MEGRQVHNELRGLLEGAAVQQTESSMSRQREPEAELPVAPSWQEWEASVHPEPQRAPERNKALSVRDRLGDDANMRAILNARWRNKEDGAMCGYYPCQGGCYDSEEDQSPSPKPPGSRVFSEAIRRARFPARFHQPANIVK
jgi:hypothetical protein